MLLEVLHHVFVLLGCLDACHLVNECVFLHVVSSIERVTDVNGERWIVLQHFGECNVIYEFVLVELIWVRQVRVLFEHCVYFFFSQLRHVDFEQTLRFLLVAHLLAQLVEVIELFPKVDSVPAYFGFDLRHDFTN